METNDKKPTPMGIEKYPPDGYYWVCEGWTEPCMCKPECESNCKGECGCEACHGAYGDFLGMPD